MFVWGFSISCPKRSIKNWVSLNLMITSVIVIIAIQAMIMIISVIIQVKTVEKLSHTLSNYSKCPNCKCPSSKCPKIQNLRKSQVSKNVRCWYFLNLEFRSLEFFETFKFWTLGIAWTFEFGHFDFRYLALLNTCNFWHLEFLTLWIWKLGIWTLEIFWTLGNFGHME